MNWYECFFYSVENVLSSYYREMGQSYDNISFPPSAEYGQASSIADITTSFFILIAIFFPSVTGKLTILISFKLFLICLSSLILVID